MPEAKPITVKSVDFSPRNEGEEASYTFVFVPSSQLSDIHQIFIDFPPVYDDRLGVVIVCEALNGITSQIDCVSKEKRLYITGLSFYEPSDDNPIEFKITGIVNPNRITKKP